MKVHSQYMKNIPSVQTPLDIVQAAPVQNTWYTALAATPNVRIHSITLRVDTTGEDLALRVTMDGVVFEGTVSAVAGTTYQFYTATQTDLSLNPISTASGQAMFNNLTSWRDTRNCTIQFRKTSAAGAGNINCKVQYDKW